MADPSLSDADLEALRQVQQFREQQARISDAERRPVTSPGKYSFPIGMDDAGNFFPAERGAPAQSPDEPTRSRDAGRRTNNPTRPDEGGEGA